MQQLGQTVQLISGFETPSIQFGPFHHSQLDVNYAVQPIERFRRTIVDPIVDDTHLNKGLGLGLFRNPERLTFSAQPEWIDIPAPALGDAIRYAEPSAIMMCDRSILISDIIRDFSERLIERRLYTTRNIVKSISPTNCRCPRISKALTKNSRFIGQYSPSDQDYEHGYDYYLALLAYRKQYGSVIRKQVELEFGRTARPDEWPQIVEHYSGRNGRIIAEFGERNSNDRNMFLPEELLSLGLLLSISQGADVYFLTADPIMLDQFISLCTSVSSHYLAHRVGKCIEAHPTDFPVYSLEAQRNKPAVDIHDLSPGWKNTVLPSHPFLLNLHCWLLRPGPGICVSTFCVERPMHRLLAEKGVSKGLNICRPDGKNVQVGQTMRGDFATFHSEELLQLNDWNFPKDERLQLQLQTLPKIDIARVVNQRTPFNPVWFV